MPRAIEVTVEPGGQELAQPLITKYRPLEFSEVFGHAEILRGLQNAVSGPSRPHSFLLTGPSGVGKTTLARILATVLDAEVVEVDAASNNGVEAVRELITLGHHRPLTRAAKMIICNECQRFSRPAWDVLLMLLEEPPDYLYVAITTTEFGKVPDAVVTRCYHAALRPLRDSEIEDLLGVVCELENWRVEGDVMRHVVAAATGQPRKALSLMQSCHDAPNIEEARRIINLQTDDSPVIRLLSSLARSGGYSWEAVRADLRKVFDDDADFEEVSTLAGRYLTGIILRSGEKEARRVSSLLESLVQPASTWDRKVAFLAAVTRYLWGAS